MFAGLRELLRSGAIRDIGSKSGTIYFLSPPLVTLTLYNSGGRCPVPIVRFYPTKSGELQTSPDFCRWTVQKIIVQIPYPHLYSYPHLISTDYPHTAHSRNGHNSCSMAFWSNCCFAGSPQACRNRSVPHP